MAHMLTVPERKLVPMSSTAISQIGRAGLVEELKRIPGAPDPVLLETLPMGVAFHHAGVPFATSPFNWLIGIREAYSAVSSACLSSSVQSVVTTQSEASQRGFWTVP